MNEPMPPRIQRILELQEESEALPDDPSSLPRAKEILRELILLSDPGVVAEVLSKHLLP